MFTKIFLILQGLGFILFGAYCFFNPQAMIDVLGAPSMSSEGVYEMRGIYGGVTFAMGVLILFGGLKQTMRRTALFALLAYTGGYAISRILALPLDGLPSGPLLMAAVYETITALICLMLLRRDSLLN